MALPKIAPYPMPNAADLPTNRVDWTVDPTRAALLVHDLQNYFLSAFTPNASPITELLANVARLKDDCDRLGVPVVYSAQPGGQTAEQRGLQQDFWGPGLPDDLHAAAVAAPVAPGPADTVLTKWKYSAFVRTELRRWMRDLERDQLIIVGVYAHIGVTTTACDAWMQDIQTFVVADAVADFTSDNHRMALSWAAANCAVVTDTQSLFAGK
ncbi:isochorismatase family protein [Embleya sp. NPDC055664]|uniref:isochorismatase family protein n=1 Tax=Embleya sp. NPDC059237 TaxID=3346784 RepID=UPI003676ACB2